MVVLIREYDPSTDREGTEAVDRDCEVGPTGGMSLHADLLGDPVARIRHSPAYLMLVCTNIHAYLSAILYYIRIVQPHQCARIRMSTVDVLSFIGLLVLE